MSEAPAEAAARPYRVLSLDGGGMRGIYTAAFLDRLVTQFARTRHLKSLDLGRGFDLITGTSTRAIVARALALGRPMSEVAKLYREQGRRIFPHRIKGTPSAIWRMFVGGHSVRKGDAVLRKALIGVLGQTTMYDVFERRGISLSIPAVLMSSHRSWVFEKTPASRVRDDHYKLVDVCMASSAAPIFRSLAAVDDPHNDHGVKQVFADGGLWANNQIMVGLVDALACAPRWSSKPGKSRSRWVARSWDRRMQRARSTPEARMTAPTAARRARILRITGIFIQPVSCATKSANSRHPGS
jgi:patatin-like phospholipase/acyl hydrolase